jgi:hypothetical protein
LVTQGGRIHRNGFAGQNGGENEILQVEALEPAGGNVKQGNNLQRIASACVIPLKSPP